ncbi:hypothetical protein HQ865_01255 [Mucilaginibacter mali]|uniref:Uncharacterized protein n=1 Tax=Mucilaginibacter mali TaxID=2740462 RepID=A0A7D4UJ26_9SPHI|nr:hypothetical protein [Mucilaginibacter mali]QKJ28442.1 hypothetical protein HQ865_01255 [Mucilaginibacter mali]
MDENTKNEPELKPEGPVAKMPNLIQVDADELATLIEQNTQAKALLKERTDDLIQLVALFSKFTAVINGGNIVSAVMKITTDKNLMATIGAIVPVVEKYTVSHEQKQITA